MTKSKIKARTLYLYATSEDNFKVWLGGENKQDVDDGIWEYQNENPMSEIKRIEVIEVFNEREEMTKQREDMPQIDRIIEALIIIKKYEPDADFAGENDVFYCGGDNYKEYSQEDKDRLETLGCIYDDDLPSLKFFV